MGISKKLGIHCGKQAGSVCNRLTRNRNNPKRLEMIKFENAEKNIDSLSFEDFYKLIVNDKVLIGNW